MKTKKDQKAKERKEEAKRLYREGFAVACQQGRDLEERHKEAAEWYLKAARLGLAEAQYALGMHYRFDRGCTDEEKARKWLRAAAEQGHTEAQYRMGEVLEFGRDRKADAEAAMWYRKAARKGHKEAMCALAGLYEIGHGVRQSYALAFKWYLKAAEQYDYCDAQYHLGLMYLYGDGVRKVD